MSRRRFMGKQSYDADALRFIKASGITTDFQKEAIDYLVTSLKSAGLWSKMEALYPFCGGTANAHKYNLIDPNMYMISWEGGEEHTSLGMIPRGSHPSLNMYISSLVSKHMSLYIGNNISSNTKDLGQVGNSTTNLFSVYIRFEDGKIYFDCGAEGTGRLSTNMSNTAAFFLLNKDNNLQTIWRNTSKLAYKNNTINTISSTLMRFNGYYGPETNSGRQYRLASIGAGLTDSEWSTFYGIVQQYQQKLNRAV